MVAYSHAVVTEQPGLPGGQVAEDPVAPVLLAGPGPGPLIGVLGETQPLGGGVDQVARWRRDRSHRRGKASAFRMPLVPNPARKGQNFVVPGRMCSQPLTRARRLALSPETE